MQDGMAGWPETKDDLAASLGDADLSSHAIESIAGMARPALMLAAAPTDADAIVIGATRIGGRPDLPPGMAWPERPAYANADQLAREALSAAERFHADAGKVPPWMSAEEGTALFAENARVKAETLAFMKTLEIDDADLDAAFSFGFSAEDAAVIAREAQAKAEIVASSFPLAFLAQIDLAAVSSQPGFDAALPRDGRLLFFYDLLILPPSFSPHADVGLRVLHDCSPTETLVRAELPSRLMAIADIAGTALRAASVIARSAVTVVPEHSRAAEALALDEDDAAAYSAWLTDTPGWPGDGEAGAHQLGGWRRAIQATMESTAQLAANGIDAGTSEAFATPEAKRLLQDEGAWRLIFQLGPDAAIGNMLPGALNILMRDEDIAAGRFEKAWAVYEQS